MDQPGMFEGRPLPADGEVSAPYWAGLRAGELLLQRCERCQHWQFPPDLSCGTCGSAEVAWVAASGDATLYSWTIAHPPLLPFFAAQAPWPVAAVELAEGVRMVTNLVGLEIADYEFGMRLKFEPQSIADDVVVPAFRSAS